MQKQFRYTLTALAILTMVVTLIGLRTAAASEPITWWLLADSHIGHRHDVGNLQLAVTDVNALGGTHHAMVLGDCIDERDEDSRPSEGYSSLTQIERWELFETTMNQMPHDWSYVLGNHDVTGRTPPVNSIVDPNWFSTMVNGVRIIGISDEHLSEEYYRPLEMSQEQKDWFEAEMASNPELPTIIMSHQNRIDRYGIENFEYMSNWLDDNGGEYNVVMWINAHDHGWRIAENVNEHGLREMTVNDILRGAESAFMTITPLGGGLIDISFQFRDHLTGEWIEVEGHQTYSFQLEIDAVTASGIPYSWLENHGLPTDGSMDHEKIGASPFTVYEEWIAGTNPNDITDILRMTESPERTPEGFIVRWQSVADRTYTIERSQDLTADPQFESVAAGIQGIDGVSEYLDETADSLGPFLYRVVVEQE